MLATNVGLEVIQQCLNLSPVPCLGAAFSIFRSIWTTIETVQGYKGQLKELARSICYLLCTLNRQYRDKEPLEASTFGSLIELGRLLEGILGIVRKQSTYGSFKLLFLKQDIQQEIDDYHQRITTTIQAFQIAALTDIQYLQMQNNSARNADREQLLDKFRELESNQNLLVKALHTQKDNPMVTMAALQKRINERQGDEAEIKFFSRSLDYIKQSTGRQVDFERWMITSLEVEFGKVLRKGGFGTVYQGKWNRTDVALKVLKNAEGITPRDSALRNEVETWSRLHHPHILQFLGVSVLDDEPFIVMPLIKRGNVREYLDKNPSCDRLKIIQQISLGIVYLHSKNVIHGDLKAANVLIDDGENALLCDFGLSRIKEDVDSRSSSEFQTRTVRGSLNWMPPERLEGGSLRKPCDIYSFSMTMYEVHTNENPFGGVSQLTFDEL